MSHYVDPATRDYVLKDGHFQPPPATVEQEVYFRLTIKRSTYLDDPDMGSRLWELERERVPSRAALKVKGMVREALQPMLERRAIKSLTVATLPSDRRLDIKVRLTDAGDVPYSFALFQPVGA